MNDSPAPAPGFGDPIRQRPASSAAVERLMLRKSASAMTLGAPGPSQEDVGAMLKLAARAPDHGKLFPWRFIVIEGEAKTALLRRLEPLAATRPDAPKATASLGKLRNPPLCVAVVSRVTQGAIPEWEQVLSAGAVCMNLLLAADALGYGANWITDWYAYDEQAKAMIGLADGERVAGFIYIGTPSEPPLERVRPDMAAITSRLMLD